MSCAAVDAVAASERSAESPVSQGPVVLAACVLANLGLVYAAGHSSLLWTWGLEVATMGIVLSSVFMLEAWLALGGQHWLPRLLVVAAPAMNLGHAVNLRMSEVPWEQSLMAAGVSLTAVLCCHALLLPLRWYGGLRLVFACSGGASVPAGQKTRIGHLLAWMIWCALPCALVRAIAPDYVLEILVTIALLGAFTLPLAATTALLVLGRRYLLWLVAVAAAWGLLCGLKALVPDFFETYRIWEFNLAVMANVGINLGVLRMCGLRLLRLRK